MSNKIVQSVKKCGDTGLVWELNAPSNGLLPVSHEGERIRPPFLQALELTQKQVKGKLTDSFIAPNCHGCIQLSITT